MLCYYFLLTFEGSKFSCITRSPCFEENRKVNGLYYEQPDPNKYIQCNEFGQCFDMQCAWGEVWKQAAKDCGNP